MFASNRRGGRWICKRTAENSTDRRLWWDKMDKLLYSLPQRNSLLVVGDYNCSLPYMPPFSGTGQFRWKQSLHSGPQHADQGCFAALLSTHGVVALNSWSSSLGPTWTHAGAASRIDFVLTRMATADGEARRPSYLWQAPFMPAFSDGHVPILCSIRKHWILRGHGGPRGPVVLRQRQAARMAMLSHDRTWQDFLDSMMTRTVNVFRQVGPSDAEVVEKLHAEAVSSFHQFFPLVSAPQPKRPWQLGACTVLTKWEHRKCIHEITQITQIGIFRAWFHWTRLSQLTRSHRKQAKQLRAQRFRDIVCDASVAAARHDMYQLFGIINKHSPKTAHRRVQLRNAQGYIATPAEAQQQLADFVADTWQGPQTMGLPFTEPPGVPFTVSDLDHALRQIPANKALASPFAPGLT